MANSEKILRRVLPAVLPRMRRFAQALARTPAEADDLVYAAIEAIPLQPSPWQPPADAPASDTQASLRDWMYRILAQAWKDSRGSTGAQPQPDGDEDTPWPHRATALEALDDLHDEHRLAVVLVLMEGFSYADAARLLEIPPGTLTARLHRGRDVLMRQLDTIRIAR